MRAVRLFIPILLIALLLPTVSAAQTASSDWWPEVEKLRETLPKERWKRVHKDAEALSAEVRSGSWHHPDLGRVLAEIAFCQAVAAAYLDLNDEAVWLWHLTLILNPRLQSRDLSAYNKAAKLFYEFPPRRLGEVPDGIRVAQSPFDRTFKAPREPKDAVIPLLRNSGAARARPHPFRAEVVLDTSGRPRWPVVLSTDLHPILIDASLRHVGGMPAWKPAELAGGPVALLYRIEMAFRVNERQ